MDPLSITLGVGTIVQLSLQLGMYLKNVYDAAASFEEEIEFLMREIQDVESINTSIGTSFPNSRPLNRLSH